MHSFKEDFTFSKHVRISPKEKKKRPSLVRTVTKTDDGPLRIYNARHRDAMESIGFLYPLQLRNFSKIRSRESLFIASGMDSPTDDN